MRDIGFDGLGEDLREMLTSQQLSDKIILAFAERDQFQAQLMQCQHDLACVNKVTQDYIAQIAGIVGSGASFPEILLKLTERKQ